MTYYYYTPIHTDEIQIPLYNQCEYVKSFSNKQTKKSELLVVGAKARRKERVAAQNVWTSFRVLRKASQVAPREAAVGAPSVAKLSSWHLWRIWNIRTFWFGWHILIHVLCFFIVLISLFWNMGNGKLLRCPPFLSRCIKTWQAILGDWMLLCLIQCYQYNLYSST